MAAEYHGLCHQVYNLARMRLDMALAKKSGDKPLAVLTDADDIIPHVKKLLGHPSNQGKDFFDDTVWDE